MTPAYDVAVIGAGIVGLAHAWMAARRGLRVLLLERAAAAKGASVRNFGMIWPVGQPAGELYARALRSRELWLELNSRGAVPAEQCGAIHLAHRPDELVVQEEFCARGTHEAQMLAAKEVAERSGLANTDGLLGGMFSPTELRVDARQACARLARWLSEAHGVECCFDTTAIAIDDRVLRSADGRRWRAQRIVICGGSDLRTLFPEVLTTAGLLLCKLQMLKTMAQPSAGRSAPHLASGLTLRHYAAFRDCPSLKALESRIDDETPELNRFGIHVMASPLAGGEVILGDSHEYGHDIAPFDKVEIDELILREARKVFRLNDWSIRERWHGIYAKYPQLPAFEATPAEGIHLFTATGGAGMTMSFGLAERAWKRWMGDRE